MGPVRFRDTPEYSAQKLLSESVDNQGRMTKPTDTGVITQLLLKTNGPQGDGWEYRRRLSFLPAARGEARATLRCLPFLLCDRKPSDLGFTRAPTLNACGDGNKWTAGRFTNVRAVSEGRTSISNEGCRNATD